MYPDNIPPRKGRRCPPDAVDLLPFRPMLRRIARRHLRSDEGEDLVQEVLLRALTADTLPCEEGRLRGFLGSVARHVCIDWLRRKQRTPTLFPLEDTDLAVADPAARATLARNELETLLAGLPADVRATLLLRHGDELSHGEIARRLGTTPGAVAVRLHRARKRVRRRACSRWR